MLYKITGIIIKLMAVLVLVTISTPIWSTILSGPKDPIVMIGAIASQMIALPLEIWFLSVTINDIRDLRATHNAGTQASDPGEPATING